MSFEFDSLTSFVRLVILILYYSLAWQFLLFIRTDIYYVISNFFECRNLYNDSWNHILTKLPKPFKAKRDVVNIPPREFKIVKIYAPIMLIATIFSVSVFILMGLPIIFLLFLEGITLLVVGFQSSFSLFVEGLVLTGLMGLQIGGFVLFLVRSFYRFKSHLV